MPASDWSELCPATIIWEALASRDAYGKPTYAAPVTFAPPLGGRRVFKTVRKYGGMGEFQFIQGSVIWILATPAIGNDDRVYVQGDAAPYPPILEITQPPDETGTGPATRVTLGSAKG